MADNKNSLDSRISDFSKKYLVEYNEDGYVGSTWGERLNDVAGWESTTAGMYGDLRLGVSQTGIKNLEPASTALIEPFRLGHFLWKCIKIPPFFNPKVIDVFRLVFEGLVRGVSGIPENQISVITQQFGPVGASTDYAGIYQEGGKEFSITTLETRASSARKIIDYWLGGLSDKETGIGTLYGKNIPYCRANYGATFILVISGITGRVEDMEYACIFHDAFPTKELTGHMGSITLGDVGSVAEVEIGLTGTFQRGREVDILGQFMIAAWGIYSESSENQTLPSWTYNLYFNYAHSKTGIDAMKRNFSVKHHDRIEVFLDKVEDDTGDRDSSKLSWTTELLELRKHTSSSDYPHGPQAIIGDDNAPNRISTVLTYKNQLESYQKPIKDRKNLKDN